MFETKAEIRRAARARVREEGRQEGQKEGEQKGRQETRREVAEMLRRHVVPNAATGRITLELTPDVAAFLYPPTPNSPTPAAAPDQPAQIPAPKWPGRYRPGPAAAITTPTSAGTPPPPSARLPSPPP